MLEVTGRPSAQAAALVVVVCVVVVAATSVAGAPAAGAVLALLLGATLLLRTSVTFAEDALEVRMSPLFRRRIGSGEVAALRARTVAPLREFGGWGLRRRRKTTALLLGPKVIEIDLRDGQTIVVSLSEEDWQKARALACP